jgi:hypothetical protein
MLTSFSSCVFLIVNAESLPSEVTSQAIKMYETNNSPDEAQRRPSRRRQLVQHLRHFILQQLLLD